MITVVSPALWDVLVRVPEIPALGQLRSGTLQAEGPGGSGVNTAACLAAHGVDVRLMARVGRGPNAEKLRQACAIASWSECLHPHWLPASRDLSQCLVMVSDCGERTMLTIKAPVEAEIGAGEFSPETRGRLEQATLAWIQLGDSQRRAEYRHHAAHAPCGLPVWHLEQELQAGRQWPLLVGSCDDAPLPSEDQLDQLGCQLAVMTQGSEGVLYRIGRGNWQHVPARTVSEVVDTVGAGDAFLAGLLAGLERHPLDSLPAVHRAVEQGCEWAAEAVQRRGGWPA